MRIKTKHMSNRPCIFIFEVLLNRELGLWDIYMWLGQTIRFYLSRDLHLDHPTALRHGVVTLLPFLSNNGYRTSRSAHVECSLCTNCAANNRLSTNIMYM